MVINRLQMNVVVSGYLQKLCAFDQVSIYFLPQTSYNSQIVAAPVNQVTPSHQ